VEYIGPVINAAARITAMTHGGQILLSGATFDKVRESELASKEAKRMVCLGKFEMPDSPKGTSARSPARWSLLLNAQPHSLGAIDLTCMWV
jgi:class 3 adenylate cyclase